MSDENWDRTQQGDLGGAPVPPRPPAPDRTPPNRQQPPKPSQPQNPGQSQISGQPQNSGQKPLPDQRQNPGQPRNPGQAQRPGPPQNPGQTPSIASALNPDSPQSSGVRRNPLGPQQAAAANPASGPNRAPVGRRPSTPDRPPVPRPPDNAADPTEIIDEIVDDDTLDADETEALEPARAADPALARSAPAARSRHRGRRIGAAAGYTVLGLVSLLVLGITGYAWAQYTTLDAGIHKSDALTSPTEKKSLNGDTNILIMGLDSRLDENGNPLPQAIYNALHAGDDSVVGYNANVLMLLHVPAHGQAVEISIPRDDYVSLPGCPDKVCHEKIKQGYGLARDQKYRALYNSGVRDKTTLEQQSRDAGRKEEADTVSQFLGGVPIDHFIEVTMVAFYQIAQVVQPITVCVQKTTHDTKSGASFNAGVQKISAQQAVAFVRQRRDNVKGDFYYNNFTDLDRERRQQAFISSLAFQLRQKGTFTDPSKITGILNVAKQNTAIDSGLDLLELAEEASNLTSGQITFNTLPVQSFVDKGGSTGDVNIVDLPAIQAEVRQLLGTPNPSPNSTKPIAGPGSAATPKIVPGVVDVVNRSGEAKMAGNLETALAAKGFTQGAATTDDPTISTTVVEYDSSSAEASAESVAALLGGASVQRSSTAKSGRVRVVLGRDFSMPAALSPANTAPPASTKPAAPPQYNSLTAPSPLEGGSVPCVK